DAARVASGAPGGPGDPVADEGQVLSDAVLDHGPSVPESAPPTSVPWRGRPADLPRGEGRGIGVAEAVGRAARGPCGPRAPGPAKRAGDLGYGLPLDFFRGSQVIEIDGLSRGVPTKRDGTAAAARRFGTALALSSSRPRREPKKTARLD